MQAPLQSPKGAFLDLTRRATWSRQIPGQGSHIATALNADQHSLGAIFYDDRMQLMAMGPLP